MFEDFNISPYPGLRSFSEDESLFFKGRDSHIKEIVNLLQENKFLMVTGASGDGKSSIIFSGLVPNARAGFFKADYNRWEVAQFRPERTPVKNLAHVLSGIFGSPPETLQTELNRGFGSLVDLYKGSDLYRDQTTSQWQNADEEEKKSMDRSTANLLVIVDQFEEFFTNPENFRNGAPTEEAQVLINLLLETAKISLRDDIPIYVVFTMRSDYIGQCAAFRGLPEFIGFSQFFVPRLKRKELKQIIEEPAVLNGNSISPRLVERILYDMSEGVDQLPVLQHALSQIWHSADNGKAELDLIHYAKVGGMLASELPDEFQDEYADWYATLESWHQEHLKNPSLHRILDIHADHLFENSWAYYQKQNVHVELTRKEAKFIIAIVFSCLTKIDHSRAVRNRMTLLEITNIINQQHITTEVVGAVVNSYREQGNTFVRPFIEENDPDSNILQPESVLDITHESLIRNWQRLTNWVNKEYEYYEIFLDFEKQLNKWIANKKDNGYLLPIGPLTFFEKWKEDCRPNKYWINRYNTTSEDTNENLSHSSKTLNSSEEFLKKSSRKVIVSKTFMKYGTVKIATALAIILVTFLSGYYYNNALQKQNDYVLKEITKRGSQLLTDDQIGNFGKGRFLVSSELVFEGSLVKQLNTINTTEEKLNVALFSYTAMLILDRSIEVKEKYDLIGVINETLENEDLDLEKELYYINSFIDLLGYDYYLNNSPMVGSTLHTQTEKIPDLIDDIVQEGRIDRILTLNQAIENFINWNNNPRDGINRFLSLLSPFESSSYPSFMAFYPAKGGIRNGRTGNISHNGGYQELASLYASTGNLKLAEQATDSLVKYSANYFEIMSFNNATNILGYFVQFEYLHEAEQYLNYLNDKTGLSKRRLMMLTMDHSTGVKYMYFDERVLNESNYNPGLSILSLQGIEFLFDLNEKVIKEEENSDAEAFYLALLYKYHGSILSYINHLPSNHIDSSQVNHWYRQAVRSYSTVSEKFKQESEEINYRYWNNGIRKRSFTHEYFFLYPDYFYNQWQSDKFISTSFIEFLIISKQFGKIYSSGEDLEHINDWIANYYEYSPFSQRIRNLTPLDSELLYRLEISLNQHASGDEFDRTFIQLLLANDSFEKGDIETAMKFTNALDIEKISPLANRWEYLNYTYVYNLLVRLAKNCTLNNFDEQALDLIEATPNAMYKSFIYSEIANFLYKNKQEPKAFAYLDSAYANYDKVNQADLLTSTFDPRYSLITTLSGIGGSSLTLRARNLFIEMPPGIKTGGLFSYVTGMAYQGNYFQAVQAIPEQGPTNQEINHYSDILFEEARKNGVRNGWGKLNTTLAELNGGYYVFRDNN